MNKFVLKRKNNRFRQTDSERPKIHIRPEIYAVLCDWANETGMTMTDIVGKAISFAATNLVWDEEE